MTKRRTDAEREQRIMMDIVVDAHDSEERAMGWFYYLEDRLGFSFTATCAAKRAISPLRVGDEVEVLRMGPEDECGHEIFVVIRWEKEGLAVPLSQLRVAEGSAETKEAVEDWRYWIAQGHEF